MFGKLALVAVVVMTAVPTISAVPQRRSLIGDDIYFVDIAASNRNRDQALAYCVAQGATLARITPRAYTYFRLTLASVGSYWVDGKDKATSDRFEVDETCKTGELDLAGVPLKITAASCLSLVKGTSEAASSISSVPCSNGYRGVICYYPTTCNAETSGEDGDVGDDGGDERK